MANMYWQSWPQKAAKEYNFIPQMPNKFVERAFLVGGFVGSKSQAGSSPSRAQISLNDVIVEQLFNLGLNIYTDILSVNCDSARKLMCDRAYQSFSKNFRTNNIECNNYNRRNKNMMKNCGTSYIHQLSGKQKSESGCKNSTNTCEVPALRRQSQEEIVYEDKDEGGNSIYVYQEVQKSTCEVTKTSMFHVRSRTISECSIESDDSFIIFESNGDDDCDNVISNEEEEDDEDEENLESPDTLRICKYDDSSSDESDDCDEVDYLALRLECHSQKDTPSRVEEANKKWNETYGYIKPLKSPQKVSFAKGKQLTQIRKMVTWDFAHRNARKGPWETLALDSSRFRTKIQQLSNVLNPILEQNFRQIIYKQRFDTSS